MTQRPPLIGIGGNVIAFPRPLRRVALAELLPKPPRIVASAVDADAELIRRCAAFVEAHEARKAETDDEAWERACDVEDEHYDAAGLIPATTPAGLAAKANAALVRYFERLAPGDEPDGEMRFMLQTLRDAVSLPRKPVRRKSSPFRHER